MTSERLAQFENDLRSAVKHRRFAEIGRLAELFCAAAETRARSLPAGDPAREQLARHVEETLDWARTMLCVARAATTEEMRKLPFLTRYVGTTEPRRAGVHVDG